jgi:hypothetical protein
MLNVFVFSYCIWKLSQERQKMCVHISASVAQKLYLSTFVLFRNVCFLFLILEYILKRSLFISYAARGYNSTGLWVSFCSGLETSGSDNMCSNMFDVLSNEKSRKSWRGFDLLTLTPCWRIICQQSMCLKYFPPKNKHEMKVPM